MSAEDCVFCRIVRREAPGTIVDEDDRYLALVPLSQETAGHTLVLPKSHATDLMDIDAEALGGLAAFAQRVARRLVYETGATGINLLHASGKDAQQSVFHFHVHLVPRHKNDGLDAWIARKEPS